MKKLITLLHGFCMALADSVPGVSGGTIAFLMGFYDNFIGSLNALISGSKQERIQAVKYLIMRIDGKVSYKLGDRLLLLGAGAGKCL